MNDRIGIDYNAIAGADYQRRAEDAEEFERAVRDEVAAMTDTLANGDTMAIYHATTEIADWIPDPVQFARELFSVAGHVGLHDTTVGQHLRKRLNEFIENAAMAKVARREDW